MVVDQPCQHVIGLLTVVERVTPRLDVWGRVVEVGEVRFRHERGSNFLLASLSNEMMPGGLKKRQMCAFLGHPKHRQQQPDN